MSRKPSQPDPHEVEQELVAYLDGELDAETAGRVERLIATDPTAREHLQRLDQAWEMLDLLPQAEVDDEFTHSTIEMIALSAEQEVRLEQDLVARRGQRRLLLGAAGVLLAAAAGFVTVSWLPDPNEQLLRDLPVLLKLTEYRQVEDVEFLRKLKEKNLFPEEPQDAD